MVHHEVGNVLEADGRLVQFASVLGRNAIDHARRVERTHHAARPLLAFEQPLKQNRETFMRIDEAAVFGHRADAVGITVNGQARMALLFHYRFLQQRDVGHNRFGVDPRKQRIHFLPDGHVLNGVLVEDARQDAAPGTIHRVDGELKFAFRIRFRSANWHTASTYGGLRSTSST